MHNPSWPDIHMKNKALIISAAILISACAVSRVDPLSVPLSYSSEPKNTAVVGALSCNAISQLQVSDARTDKTLGVRTHESRPLKADVTTPSDVATWAHDGLQAFLSQNGFSVPGSGPALAVSVDSLHTTESIWHRSSYEARIALTGRLSSASGKICWSETVQGVGGDYGYSGSIENYRHALNSSLDAAALKIAQEQSFKDALCSCGK
jgi:hypothetical protein